MSKQLRASREEILECQVMWEPDSKKNTQMDRFRAAVGAACGLALADFWDSCVPVGGITVLSHPCRSGD